MEPWILTAVGGGLLLLGAALTRFFIWVAWKTFGESQAGLELARMRGQLVPRAVSLLYLIGLGVLVGGAIWWAAEAF